MQGTPHTGRRVLVVDDNVDAATVLAELLQDAGHETRMAHDGHEAIAICLEFCPDFCLLDVELPTLNGYGVARRLRADARRTTPLTVIAMTGYSEAIFRKDPNANLFDGHLLKPVDVDSLLRLLGEVP